MSDLGPRPFRFRALWILLAAGVLISVPALRGDVLSYDDRNLLLGDEGAFARSPVSFFTETYYYAYLPFYGLSYWVDGKLGGQSAVLIHFANALWHVAASYLVFCVLAMLLRDRLGALFGAVIFAVHPLHVESVAWISGRKEVMGATFLFLAWLLHLRKRTAWALVAFVVACFTKATAIVLPGMMLAAAWLLPRYEGERGRAARGTIPFFVVALLPIVVHLMVGAQAGVVRAVGDVGGRMLSWVNAWGVSIFHTCVPFDLSIDYPEGPGASTGGALTRGIFVVAAVVTAWAYRNRAPVVTFGITVFFVALAPHNNVFPATDVHIADRYLYVAIFGLSAIVGWAAGLKHNGRVGMGLLAVVLFVMSFISASRFQSDEELWTRTIAARGDSSLAYFQRGISRAGRADTKTPPDRKLRAKAIEDLEKALVRARLNEHRLKAAGGLVLPLINHGQAARALERAAEAFELLKDIDSPEASRFSAQLLYHRGIAHTALGQYAAAAADCHAANRLWARYVVAEKEGEWWLLAGQPAAAIEALGQASELDPASEVPYLLLAKAGRMTGNMTMYKRALEEASRRAPKSDEVAGEWVKFHMYGASPNFNRAREALHKLPKSSPRRARLEAQVEALHALYRFRRGDLRPALEAADRARKLGLGSVSMQYELGQIYMEAGRYDDAVKCYRASADVLSQSPAHRDAVARAYSLKAYKLLTVGQREMAADAMRLALAARPAVIEAGAVPLRGEIQALRETQRDDMRLLACAAVAGDPGRSRDLADEILKSELSEKDTLLARTLRGLVRAFAAIDFDGAEDDLGWVVRHGGGKWARYRLAQIWIKAGTGWLRTAEQLKSEERRKQGRGLIDRAIAELTKLTESEPGFLYARLLRGQAYFALDRLSAAKTEYEHIRDHDKTMKEVYVHEAALHRLSFVKGGQFETLGFAEKFLGDALRLDPNYFDALFELGNVYHLRYDRAGESNRRLAFLRAAKYYRRAMAINPHARSPRLEWARLLLKAGQEAIAGGEVLRAHQLIERLEAEAKDIAAVHKQRVKLNLLPGFGKLTKTRPDQYYAAAGRALNRARKLTPDDPEIKELFAEWHLSRAMSYSLTSGKFAAAARNARKLKDKKADLYDKKMQRAKELAVEQYVAALKAWPDHPDAEAVRLRIRALAPEFIKLDQNDAKIAYEEGIQALRARRYDEAVTHFRDVLRLFPEYIEVRHYLGMALLRSGKTGKARAELERVANAEGGGDFPEAMFELGNIFRAKKNPVVARVWYERYIEAMQAKGRTAPEVDIAKRILKELK